MKHFRTLSLAALMSILITLNISNVVKGASYNRFYVYKDDAVYAVSCQVGMLTDIQLQPGEDITFVGGGDTARWSVEKSLSGSGASQRYHLYISPAVSGVTTTLVINTTLRSYHLQLYSRSTYNAVIEWSYPTTKKNRVKQKLNYRYKIVCMYGKSYPWKPVTVYDDGTKTYIKMPQSLKSSEAPVLYIKSDNELSLVNYHIQGSYYVVDRLFEIAQLKVGNDVVEIMTQKGYRDSDFSINDND